MIITRFFVAISDIRQFSVSKQIIKSIKYSFCSSTSLLICRLVGNRFDLGKSTLSGIFIVTALNEISPEIILWPNIEQRQRIALSFQASAGIEGIVGAIDGTYIPIKAPSVNPDVYINRKCFHAITLQVICKNNMSILDCFAGYPSRVSDIRIFRNSPIYEEFMNNYFDERQFIIGDKAYPVLQWCTSLHREKKCYRKAKTFQYLPCQVSPSS